MGQYNSDGVFQTTDGGTIWTNISTGLPAIPVMCVVQNTQNTTQIELYAGTDVGVYVKVGTANWALFSDGLPNVVVNELEIYYNSGTPGLSRIRAASSGRGLWESELYSPANQPPLADFSADNTSPGLGQTVNFTDLSTNLPTSWSWVFTPSSVSYTGGTSSTSQNPQVQFNDNTDYTVQLTSTNAYGSDVENKVDYISVSTLQTYCTASGGGDEYISGVQIGTINNTGTAADGYTSYTSLATDITINQSNNITLTYGVGYADDDLGIWIDWNQDGDFDDAGENAVCTVGLSYLTETYSFTVPVNALLGSTTMRIRLKYYDADCGDPCGATSYGEVEDYKVNILPGLNNWIGNTTDWYTSSNWSDNNVPTSSYNVVIPIAPSGGNFPIVPTGNTANCNDLIIHDGATITVDGTLNVGNN
jgi:PKD repeat protein